MSRSRKAHAIRPARRRRPALSAQTAVRAFFQVVTTDEARVHIAARAPVGSEVIRIADGDQRVLAADMHAPGPLPEFHRANMDGYAVRAQDTFGASTAIPAYLRLAGAVEMGRQPRRALRKGEAMRIPTGGMLPAGADAVVMVEHSDEIGGATVEVHRSVAPWEHVLRVGEDIAPGDLVFARGRRLRARDLGALTGLGILNVRVFRRPRVALLSTGDEIVPPDAEPAPGQVRNINAYSLAAMIRQAGGVVTDFGVVTDEYDALRQELARATRRHDVVLLSGGSSVGAKDLVIDVIQSLTPSRIIFHGISVAPGKPTILAEINGLPVLGLPGHPVSALVIFDLFGAPLLRVRGGEDPANVFDPQRAVRAQLTQNVPSQPGREDYIRVRLGSDNGRRTATPLAGKSGAIFNLIKADGLVRIPAAAEGLDADSEVDVILL